MRYIIGSDGIQRGKGMAGGVQGSAGRLSPQRSFVRTAVLLEAAYGDWNGEGVTDWAMMPFARAGRAAGAAGSFFNGLWQMAFGEGWY